MNKSLLITKNGLLILLFALLLIFFKGPNLLYGGLAFALIAGYHLLTDRRFTAEQIVESGLMTVHLAVYLLLCTLLIWATTGEEESNYWIIYFLPIIVASTNLNLLRTLIICMFSSLFYLAMIPNAILSNADTLHEEMPEFLIFCTTFFIVGVVIQGFSDQNRHQLQQQKQLNTLLLENHNALQESILKLKATEETLRRKDRLAALGEMSAGLAHEIRNPLGIISSSAQLLQSYVNNTNSNAKQLLEVIREESGRLNTLVSDFLKFGRPAQPQLKQYPLEELVQRAVEYLYQIGEEHKVQLDYQPPQQSIPVLVDSAMIQQLLLNLLLNAIEACDAGGQVTIKLRSINHHAEIAICDNGMGIDNKELRTIFNPFFTTKNSGTGLGLSTAHKIVESHGGDIHVRSRMGSGSCFTVILPEEEG